MQALLNETYRFTCRPNAHCHPRRSTTDVEHFLENIRLHPQGYVSTALHRLSLAPPANVHAPVQFPVPPARPRFAAFFSNIARPRADWVLNETHATRIPRRNAPRRPPTRHPRRPAASLSLGWQFLYHLSRNLGHILESLMRALKFSAM